MRYQIDPSTGKCTKPIPEVGDKFIHKSTLGDIFVVAKTPVFGGVDYELSGQGGVKFPVTRTMLLKDFSYMKSGSICL